MLLIVLEGVCVRAREGDGFPLRLRPCKPPSSTCYSLTVHATASLFSSVGLLRPRTGSCEQWTPQPPSPTATTHSGKLFAWLATNSKQTTVGS